MSNSYDLVDINTAFVSQTRPQSQDMTRNREYVEVDTKATARKEHDGMKQAILILTRECMLAQRMR